MNHIAIDLGSKKSQVCVRSATGAILREVRVRTADLEKLLKLEERANVVMEASSEAFHVARLTTRLGHEVKVAPGREINNRRCQGLDDLVRRTTENAGRWPIRAGLDLFANGSPTPDVGGRRVRRARS